MKLLTGPRRIITYVLASLAFTLPSANVQAEPEPYMGRELLAEITSSNRQEQAAAVRFVRAFMYGAFYGSARGSGLAASARVFECDPGISNARVVAFIVDFLASNRDAEEKDALIVVQQATQSSGVCHWRRYD
jgi:hypothetical protein